MIVLAKSATMARLGFRPRRLRSLVAATTATVAVACACLLSAAQPSVAQPPSYEHLTGSGSTWAQGAISQWDADVETNYGLQVSYGAGGSTTGRNDFKNGVDQFAASEIPYGQYDGTTYDKPPSQGYAYMPDVAGGTTFMYNLKVGTHQVTNLRLSGKSIADIFTGVDQFWDATEIKHDNPQINLPHIAIIPVVREDGAGSTADLTDWMNQTEHSIWATYLGKTRAGVPVTSTSFYPLDQQLDPTMTAQNGDPNVAGYITQAQSNGAIGYVEYYYAISSNFPVAKVLNADGYYTEPTPGHVAVSLLKAQIDYNKSDVNYLTENLSGVYTDTDPRTYELSAYSYFILPTSLGTNIKSNAQGLSLGVYGSYLLCRGQNEVDHLGYSALPINLVLAGYQQLAKIPGAQIPNTSGGFVAGCNNPTFSTNGTNTLAVNDPNPPACDRAGTTQCSTATGGAPGSNPVTGTGSNPGGNTGTNPGNNNPSGNTGTNNPGGNTGTSNSGGGTNPGGGSNTGGGTQPSSSATIPGSSPSSNGATTPGGAQSTCDPNTGVCNSATAGGNGTVANGASGVPVPVSLSASNDDGVQVMLMSLTAALFLGLCVIPPLVAQAGDKRRHRRRDNWPGGPGGNGGPGAWQ
jgi:ABC-type phosphate transport system substrate-binding protein